MGSQVGVWLVGCLGGVATTVIVGARALAHRLVSDAGVLTNRPEFAHLGLVPIEALVFGGHDVRGGDLWSSAYEIHRRSGALDLEVLQALRPELSEWSKAVRPGTALNCGEAIAAFVDRPAMPDDQSLRGTIERLRGDLREFRSRHDLARVVVVNLASTEPDLPPAVAAVDDVALERVLSADDEGAVRPSMLYAYAAFAEGCAYINFTPSTAALGGCMAMRGVAAGVPFMGNDGKTGETLVKSALAPMFRHRNLQVMSWQGYNILGDRDGQVLSHEANLATKLRSKDSVVSAILGYPLHTHVGIDYVESLDDRKTAWDFIHFKGFMDQKMSMQFTWQGCDAILAAPLVLDMVRLADLALRRRERGPMSQLASYFKSPLGVAEHDLHRQVDALMAYVGAVGNSATGIK